MQITLDLAALAAALAWPLLILGIALLYRDPFLGLMRDLPRRLKSVTLGSVGLEFSASSLQTLALPQARVDLRQGGTAADVNDSTLRGFYDQVRDSSPIDAAIVDLGTGGEWLSSRLYALSIILTRMRGLRVLVFVDSSGGVGGHFIGLCDSRSVRWALARAWPLYESARAAAELQVWGHPYGHTAPGQSIAFGLDASGMPVTVLPNGSGGSPEIANLQGRTVDWQGSPEPAAQWLRAFLSAIQGRVAPPVPDHADWVDLPSTPGVWERGAWLNTRGIAGLLGPGLLHPVIREADLQGWSDPLRLRAVVELRGDWVAVLGEAGRLDRLIDRRAALESIARQAARLE